MILQKKLSDTKGIYLATLRKFREMAGHERSRDDYGWAL
jgi:hypothetical protein